MQLLADAEDPGVLVRATLPRKCCVRHPLLAIELSVVPRVTFELTRLAAPLAVERVVLDSVNAFGSFDRFFVQPRSWQTTAAQAGLDAREPRAFFEVKPTGRSAAC
jgi:hypothetical protein